ncbi:MAG TPA: hypothetical protein PLV21_17800 [Cyclobacteriaceae bacterium]|nr:hypothetical protein [Cyclobacteriaceae bacterium]HRJ83745.1 hypothetical protein [Cyclobacteriaceae bacterium]
MILKVFRGVWFISFLAVIANLMWVYAGLPEQVVVRELEASSYAIDRDVLFYAWLAIVGIVNTMAFVFGKSASSDEAFRTWFTGLVITINIFLVIGFSFIGLYNSTEKFDFSRVGVVLYLGLGLIGVWITSWPVIVLFKKIST